MRALVTGATGFVGSHLVEELLARGARVRCTARTTSNLRWFEGKPIEVVTADLREREALDEALEGIDIVFHVAGLLRANTLEEFRRGNWLSTRNLLDAAGRRRFIFISSLAACGPSSDGRPLREDDPCRPVSRYGRSKWEAEREVLRRLPQTPVTVIRPPVVYGPRDRGLRDFYWALSWGIRPRIGGLKVTSILYVRDLVRGILEAAGEAGIGHVFFMADPRPRSYEELTDVVLRTLKRRALTIRIPDRVVRMLAGATEPVTRLLRNGGLFTRDKAVEMTQTYWVCSPEKAQRVLGWQARSGFEESFRETLNWYHQHDLI